MDKRTEEYQEKRDQLFDAMDRCSLNCEDCSICKQLLELKEEFEIESIKKRYSKIRSVELTEKSKEILNKK